MNALFGILEALRANVNGLVTKLEDGGLLYPADLPPTSSPEEIPKLVVDQIQAAIKKINGMGLDIEDTVRRLTL